MKPEQYIEHEVLQREDWYDRQAVEAKARFFRYRVITVVGGAIIPVLANLPIDTLIGKYPLKTLLITLLSLGMVFAVGVESVRHYGDLWKNYRSAQGALRRERLQFQTRAGDYAKLESDAAFQLLVERIENAIASETSATLSRMTSSGSESQKTKA